MQTRQEIPLTLNVWHSCYEALRTLLSKETFVQEYLQQLESIKSGIEETMRKESQTTSIQGHAFTSEIESLQNLYEALIKETGAVELNDLSRLIQTFLKNNPRALDEINPNDISNGTFTIPFGVTSIGSCAFEKCAALTSITIPNSVTSIGGGAFQDCTALATIRIPNSVTSIGTSAFRGCTALTSVRIPDSVTSIGSAAFEKCIALTTITIPDSVTSISSSAFQDCTALISITIPTSVISIGISAFDNCTSLTSITIPDRVTSIDDYAFRGCTALTTITTPVSLIAIGSGAFYNCTALASIRIPAGVASIGNCAFRGCTALTFIMIPARVTSIGYSAFQDCSALTTIIIDANNQQCYQRILRMLPLNLGAIAKDLSGFKERFVTTMVNERVSHGFFGSRRVPGEVTGIILAALSKTYDLPSIDEKATGKCVNDKITASLGLK